MKATPHIEVTQEGKIAKTVLMPGDPLRAKYIAFNFLENVEQFNSVRGMLGFTGTYKGHKVSVMGSGMGMPSIGIYSYELFNFYGVDRIIRIGSAGAYDPKCKVYDVVVTKDAYSESSFAKVQNGYQKNRIASTEELTNNILKTAEELSLPVHYGTVHSSDVFYSDSSFLKKWSKMGVLAVEMEAAALYMNAAKAGKRALCMLTISDCPLRGLSLSSQERQTGFCDMVKIALETVTR